MAGGSFISRLARSATQAAGTLLAVALVERARVLVVEDDPDTLAAVAETLRDEFAVWVARTGEQALEVADELGFHAHVVVVDLDLGPGMRGDQFATEYRRRAKGPTRIVVLSGVPRAYDVARGMGAAAILPKPYNAEELIRTIRILAPPDRET
jgi:DNA-binding response OmpR family regulator